jgi:hypothetical protein
MMGQTSSTYENARNAYKFLEEKPPEVLVRYWRKMGV